MIEKKHVIDWPISSRDVAVVNGFSESCARREKNYSIKLMMASELRSLGLSKEAIIRQLNLKG